MPTLVLLWWALLLSGSVSAQLPVAELSLGGQAITLEIANTPQTMSRGLMYRDSMPENHGMLFIWPSERQVAMWMKNTRIPLSVAFIDSDLRVLNIADMEPHSLEPHPSQGAARFALELNQGWFDRHGIRAGDRIEDMERLVAEIGVDR